MLPFSINTFWSLTHALSTLRKVCVAPTRVRLRDLPDPLSRRSGLTRRGTALCEKERGTHLLRVHRSGLRLVLYSFEPLKGRLESPLVPLREWRAPNNLGCHRLHRVGVHHDEPMGEGASSVSEKIADRQ